MIVIIFSLIVIRLLEVKVYLFAELLSVLLCTSSSIWSLSEKPFLVHGHSLYGMHNNICWYYPCRSLGYWLWLSQDMFIMEWIENLHIRRRQGCIFYLYIWPSIYWFMVCVQVVFEVLIWSCFLGIAFLFLWLVVWLFYMNVKSLLHFILSSSMSSHLS